MPASPPAGKAGIFFLGCNGNFISGRLPGLKVFGRQISYTPLIRMFLVLCFLISAAAFIPLTGFFFIIFIPLIIFFYSTINGRLKTATAFLIPVVAITLFSRFLHFDTPYLIIFIMGVVGLAIAFCASRNYSVEKTVLFPSLIIIGSICAYLVYSGLRLSLNPWQVAQQYIAQAIEQSITLQDQIPLPFDKEDLNTIKSNKLLIINFFTGVFPSMAVVGSLLIVWINMLMGKDILNKTLHRYPKLATLSLWKAPEFLIWIFLGALAMILIPHEQLRFFGLNLLIIVCFIYLLQGLAAISFLFQSKRVPVFFRYLFYFLIAVYQFLMIPIVAIGLLDIWIDFRKLFRNNQSST